MDLAADEPRSSLDTNPADKDDNFVESGGNGGDNKFQSAIAAWRSMETSLWTVRMLTEHADIDLTTLIPTLDAAASDIVAHQRDTLTQRKDLAQKTKDFRKLDDASKLTDIKGLLKGTADVHHQYRNMLISF
jgi:homeobox protein cut-like